MSPNVDIWWMLPYVDMVHARTTRELAAVVRHRRKTLGLTQAELAQSVGVTRTWLIDMEKGKSKVELALVLRTLAALGLVADIVAAPAMHGEVDLDALLRG